MFGWLRRRKTRPPSPEALLSVSVEEASLTVTSPEMTSVTVRRDELQRVWVETNDGGPWASDVWFVLESGEGTAAYPMGATGDKEALDWLLKLPGFELRGMDSVANARFECWPDPTKAPDPTR